MNPLTVTFYAQRSLTQHGRRLLCIIYIMRPLSVLQQKEVDTMRSKAELRRALEGRREGRHFITPTLVLCQLQVGSVDQDKVIDYIMDFDVDAINEAFDELIQRGLV